MNKKQLRVYAEKFEGVSDFVRLVSGVIAVWGFLTLVSFFNNATALGIASAIYVGLLGFVYWWVRREWRALLAPLPKVVKRKPLPPKDAT